MKLFFQILIALSIPTGCVLLGGALNAPTKTKVFVSNDAKVIKSFIETWSAYQYKVQSISCQSVTEAVAVAYSGYATRSAKGDIILIMTK